MSSSSRPGLPAGDEEFDPARSPVRDAATVMLVRDGREGLEVFMLRRTLKAVFAGGMYVFPGGAVDDADRSPDVEAWCDGLTDAEASGVLEVAGRRPGLLDRRHPGVLRGGRRPARPAGRDGAFVRFDEPEVESPLPGPPLGRPRRRLRLVDLCADEGLRLATDDIHYVSHWITPIGEPRRFDTRFFVARAPRPRSRCTTSTRPSPASGSAPPTRSPARSGASWR